MSDLPPVGAYVKLKHTISEARVKGVVQTVETDIDKFFVNGVGWFSGSDWSVKVLRLPEPPEPPVGAVLLFRDGSLALRHKDGWMQYGGTWADNGNPFNVRPLLRVSRPWTWEGVKELTPND